MLRAALEACNVVVRAPNALGDLCMATPVFARLAAHFGRERLTLVCLPAGAALLNGNVWFKEIIPYERAGRHRGMGGALAFARALRKRRFDLGVILPNSLGSALQFTLGGVKRRVGYFKEGRRFLLHAGRSRDRDANGKFVPKYTGQYFMELLDVLGLPAAPLKPTLPVSQDERAAAAAALRERGLEGAPFVVIAPGAAYGPSKLWGAERFAAVADALARNGARILGSFGPGEEAEVEAMQKAASHVMATNAGLPLGTLKGIYERASLVVTNDTGPRHIALALGRPVVCIMGPNDPRYTELDGAAGDTVIRVPVDCTPWTWPCQLKVCPIDHRCMNAISVESVLEHCRAALSQGLTPK